MWPWTSRRSSATSVDTADSVAPPLPSISRQPHSENLSSSVRAVERRTLYFAYERGSDVHGKNKLALFAALAFAFISAHVSGQVTKASDHSDIQLSLIGSTLKCSQPLPAESIRVPQPLLDRAKLKAQLATLLRDSLFDDAKGIVNIVREREIRKLANKLGRKKEE